MVNENPKAQQDHWTERGRATAVASSDVTDRPRRSVLSFDVNMTRVTSPEEALALPTDTEEVMVSQCKDEILRALGGYQRLKRILTDGNNSEISDVGLAAIAKSPSVEELDLEWAVRITDAGLCHLGRLGTLHYLDLTFCSAVSSEGVAKLQRRLPACRIELCGE
jgi:hypothetical protein